jgi:endoglucanase
MRTRRYGLGVALSVSAVLALSLTGPTTAHAAPLDPLPSGTRFTERPLPAAARTQITQLRAGGDTMSAAMITAEATTPAGTWFTGGTPTQAQLQARQLTQRAAASSTVPTAVLYNVPGRDCAQYSAGGAASDAAYRSWVDGFTKGLIREQKIIVVIEPDGLGNLPSDCPSTYRNPGTYPKPAAGTATANRIANIKYAARSVSRANPAALVYLDAGNSAWHTVGDISARLIDAGVTSVQGFSLNTSNFQHSENLSHYGTWISSCIAYATKVRAGDFTNCGHQYWNGGPANGWTGVSLDPQQKWNATTTNAAANTAGLSSRYAAALASTRPTAHFIIDTSRNGQGPWAAPAGRYRDPQTWCNPPGAGLGNRPLARPTPTAFALLDAYLWIKPPGESDGPCNRGAAGTTTDPEWDGTTDPPAGAWFPNQALQLARNASTR